MPMFTDAHISSLGYLCQNMLTSQRLTDITTIFEDFLICNSRLLIQTSLPSQTLNFLLIFSVTRLAISLRNQFPFSGRFHQIYCKAAGPMERYFKQMGLINWGGASLN